MQLQLVVVETGQSWRRALLRMVWDPKNTIGHNDYGSFERQSSSNNPEDDQQLRGCGALPLSPLHSQQATSSSMSDTDLIQRQPLLPLPAKNGLHNHITVEYEEDREDHSEDEGRTGGKANGIVKINMPMAEREEQRYPKEKWKTLVAFFCLVFGFIMSTMSLSLVHERLPDRKTYGPLPDISFDLLPEVPWALDVSEIIIMVSSNITFLIMLFHKHRFIVFRRMFLIVSLLYLMRSVTMYVTVLPMSTDTYYCSPKANETTPWLVTTRVWQLMSGFGLSINGKHTFCGDFIYSGHTVVLTVCYLLIYEYSPDSPKRVFQLLSWLSCISSIVAVFMILLARGHYTIDIIIAYFVTTRTFWIYHTLANNASLKKPGSHNHLARAWWFPLFRYFEGNVGVKVPRQHEWPLPWPRRFLHKPPNRNS